MAFLHSPLLRRARYTSQHLMHAVDWLPTFMSAIGRPGLAVSARDGVSQWESLGDPGLVQPRTEVVYNVKEKPFMAALRSESDNGPLSHTI